MTLNMYGVYNRPTHKTSPLLRQQKNFRLLPYFQFINVKNKKMEQILNTRKSGKLSTRTKWIEPTAGITITSVEEVQTMIEGKLVNFEKFISQNGPVKGLRDYLKKKGVDATSVDLPYTLP